MLVTPGSTRGQLIASGQSRSSVRPSTGGPAGSPPVEIYTQRANLFALALSPRPTVVHEIAVRERGRQRHKLLLAPVDGATPLPAAPHLLARAVKSELLISIRESRGRVAVARGDHSLIDVGSNLAPKRFSVVYFHPSYTMRVINVGDDLYLCLDHRLRIRNRFHLTRLRNDFPGFTISVGQRVVVQRDEAIEAAHYVGDTALGCRVQVDGTDEELVVPAASVWPELKREQVMALAGRSGLDLTTLEQSLRAMSLLIGANAPRVRLQKATDFARLLAETYFPIRHSGYTISVDTTPAQLMPPRFTLKQDLREPVVALDHEDATKKASNILDGLSRYGSYDKPGAPLEVALLATTDRIARLRALVDRLNRGADSFRGAPDTFAVQFESVAEITCGSVADYEQKLREFVRSPEGRATEVVLVAMPKGTQPNRSDHPYFTTKKLLLAEGLASQMVDDATLSNPRFKDMNLALNVFAKAGHVPWVLDSGLGDVDAFIGLSSTVRRVGGRAVRMMAYVNVFDRYGRWRLYQGDSASFPFDERLDRLGELVANSVASFRAQTTGHPLRTVHLHYTKFFSQRERGVIARAIQTEAPGARVAFVSINAYHPLRLFDLRSGGDGAIQRAAYLPVGEKRAYLATTGANVYSARMMGTPVPLELTVWTEPREYTIELGDISQYVLSLTRLNWASTRPFCREPVTTKFAGDIAYALSAFMDDPTFRVNPSLRDRPWFL